jgi:hypothetical protein
MLSVKVERTSKTWWLHTSILHKKRQFHIRVRSEKSIVSKKRMKSISNNPVLRTPYIKRNEVRTDFQGSSHSVVFMICAIYRERDRYRKIEADKDISRGSATSTHISPVHCTWKKRTVSIYTTSFHSSPNRFNIYIERERMGVSINIHLFRCQENSDRYLYSIYREKLRDARCIIKWGANNCQLADFNIVL